MIRIENTDDLCQLLTRMIAHRNIPEIQFRWSDWSYLPDGITTNITAENQYCLQVGGSTSMGPINLVLEFEQHAPCPTPSQIQAAIDAQKEDPTKISQVERDIFRYFFEELADMNVFVKSKNLDRHRICGSGLDTLITTCLTVISNVCKEPWMKEALEQE